MIAINIYNSVRKLILTKTSVTSQLFSLFRFFFLITFLLNSSLFSEEFIWPVKTANIPSKLSSLFGESRGDHFHNGVDLSSVDEPIISIGDGNLIYSRYSEDNPYEEHLGPGNVAWVEHKKGILSAYYHMRDGRRKNSSSNAKIEKGGIVGYTGNTGHSTGAHLHFVIAAEYGKKIINPLFVLPEVKDTYPPLIQNLYVNTDKNYSIIKEGDSIRLSKNFPISVGMIDRGEKPGQRRGIYKTKYIVNGKEYLKISFDSISLSNGKWILDSGQSFDELFYDDRYLIGNLELLSGENSISIVATDYNKNKISKKFNFIINRVNPKK